MAVDYIDPPITVDPEQLAQQAFDYLQSVYPGWAPADGNLDTRALQAAARILAVVGTLASGAPSSIFRTLGKSIHGIPAIDAAPATADTTWTMKDTAGYTIHAGTQVGVRAAGDVLVAFTVLADVIVPSGSSVTAAGAVEIVAVAAGSAGSGLGMADGPVELIDGLDYVTAITLVDETTGGVDAETDPEYLSRLVGKLQLLTPRPIIPADFAVIALDEPGVDRVLVIDGYNTADSTTGNQRMVSVFPADETGAAVSGGTKTALDARLQALREVTFIVNVADPTFTDINVTFAAVASPGFDAADVQARAVAAVTALLNPATWGRPPTTETHVWVDQPIVRFQDISTALNNVEGLDHWTALTFAKNGNTLATTDVTMTGPAALPRAHTITGVVT